MGQILHGSARTTEAIRRAIQDSQESLKVLARRHGIKQKTVAKWRKRTSAIDPPKGPREPRSTALCVEDEAIIVAFRRLTLLPLDDCHGVPVRHHDCSEGPEVGALRSIVCGVASCSRPRFRLQWPLHYFLPHRHARLADRQRSDGPVCVRQTGLGNTVLNPSKTRCVARLGAGEARRRSARIRANSSKGSNGFATWSAALHP